MKHNLQSFKLINFLCINTLLKEFQIDKNNTHLNNITKFEILEIKIQDFLILKNAVLFLTSGERTVVIDNGFGFLRLSFRL